MTEAQLLSGVLRLCEDYRILAFHSGDSRRDHGRGFPDLVLAGRYSILFAELKSSYGQFSSEQTVWKYRLLACDGCWVCWTPGDLSSGLIEKTLVRL